MNKRVFIHAGAHRTGSSSFQLCLHENRETLGKRGFDVAYPGRDGVPGGQLRLPLPRPRHGAKRIPAFAGQVRAALDRLTTGLDRDLILSEENIPGPMRHFYDGRFYPGARNRLITLGQALDGAKLHVLFVVRSYADLFVSAYRKRAEDNAVEPFEALVPKFLSMDRGWPEVVAEIRDTLKPVQMTVLPYEARGTSRTLLAQLVSGLDSATLREPDAVLNPSATDAALRVLQARYHAGEKLSRKQWREVLVAHADDSSLCGVAEFSTAERNVLDARYRADLDRLSGMTGFRFPSPAHRA